MGFSPKKPSLSDGQKAAQEKLRLAQEAQQRQAEQERVSLAQDAAAQATKDLRRRRGFQSLLSSNSSTLGGGGAV